MSIAPLPIEEQVDEIISQLDHVFTTGEGGSLIATGRQILIVRTSQFFTAGHATSGVSGSQAYIRLLGSPSPSSQVTNGYIRFVAPDQIRTPTYSTERQQINIWADQSDLSPKFPPALRGVLGVKSVTLGGHFVHRLSLQEFHWRQVA
ncbi:hypothetical protein [Sulfitobacter sp.]|uniref:hypothetical protein n=1 Tax=Sulfitobacter sp. TaxID=1903071 RepID=UPI003F6CD791